MAMDQYKQANMAPSPNQPSAQGPETSEAAELRRFFAQFVDAQQEWNEACFDLARAQQRYRSAAARLSELCSVMGKIAQVSTQDPTQAQPSAVEPTNGAVLRSNSAMSAADIAQYGAPGAPLSRLG